MSETPDLSSLLSMLANSRSDNSNMNPEELLKAFSKDDSSSSSNAPDMDTMLKIMKLMKTSQQDTPSKELLKSLKPFLKDSRKEKVDQYIRILGLSNALEILNELGDEKK